MLFWIILLILIYSFGGFYFMRDYYQRCYLSGSLPFNGSMIKFVGFSLMLGVFTAYLCIVSFVVIFWRLLNEICKK